MYIKTIEVDNDLLLKLHSGEVKLRCGQWVKLAWCSHKARWIGREPRSEILWVSHYPWSNAQAMMDARSDAMRADFSTPNPNPQENP